MRGGRESASPRERGLALFDDGCDFGQEGVALAANGADGFLGESIDGAFHFGEDVAEAGEDFDDERVFPGGCGGLADDGEEVLDEHGLVEEFGAICREGFGDDGGDGGRAAEPAAEADALGEVFVAHLFHGGADGFLGEIKLFADGFPVVLIGGVEDGLSVREDGFADAEGFGEIDDFAADVFDGFFVFGLNSDEAFGDDVTEDEGKEDAVAGLREFQVANFLAPVGFAQLVENGEDLAGNGDDDVIDDLTGEGEGIEFLHTCVGYLGLEGEGERGCGENQSGQQGAAGGGRHPKLSSHRDRIDWEWVEGTTSGVNKAWNKQVARAFPELDR